MWPGRPSFAGRPPLQGGTCVGVCNPGRCPGLDYSGPSGQTHWWKQHRRSGTRVGAPAPPDVSNFSEVVIRPPISEPSHSNQSHAVTCRPKGPSLIQPRATPWVTKIQSPSPVRVGYPSIPHIPLVIRHLIAFKKRTKLLLKCALLVVLLLFVDLPGHLGHVGLADRKGPVAALPVEVSIASSFGLDPL